jgi:hypothetical protein
MKWSALIEISAVWVGSKLYQSFDNFGVAFDTSLMERGSIHGRKSFNINLWLLE